MFAMVSPGAETQAAAPAPAAKGVYYVILADATPFLKKSMPGSCQSLQLTSRRSGSHNRKLAATNWCHKLYEQRRRREKIGTDSLGLRSQVLKPKNCTLNHEDQGHRS
jgi:hypothetical protein